MEWMRKSKCVNDSALQEWINDPANKGEDFFHDKKYATAAKKYCEDCPVRLQCLALANSALVNEDLTNPHFPKYQGVMGGTTLRQRRAFRTRMLKKVAQMQASLGVPKESYPQVPKDIAS